MSKTRFFSGAILIVLLAPSCVEYCSDAEVLNRVFSGGQLPINRRQLVERPNYLSARQCGDCHSKVYRQWRTSQHGNSFANPIYKRAFGLEPFAHCMNCHAPLWENKKVGFDKVYAYESFDLPVVSEGVNCAVCHLRGNEIITGNTELDKSRVCMLPLRYDSEINKPTFCGNCHQFNFPTETSPHVVSGSVTMQGTVEEFKKTGWSAEGKSCQNCHFKRGHHNTNSAHNAQDLKAGLRFMGKYVVAEDNSGQYLHVNMGFKQIGHAFPTGDLFHILTLYVYDANGKVIAQHDFDKYVRVTDRMLIHDNRLQVQPGEKGSSSEFWLTVPSRPDKCRVVLRLQGRIESRIQKHLTQEQLQRVAYDGPCEINQWSE